MSRLSASESGYGGVLFTVAGITYLLLAVPKHRVALLLLPCVVVCTLLHVLVVETMPCACGLVTGRCSHSCVAGLLAYVCCANAHAHVECRGSLGLLSVQDLQSFGDPSICNRLLGCRGRDLEGRSSVTDCCGAARLSWLLLVTEALAALSVQHAA